MYHIWLRAILLRCSNISATESRLFMGRHESRFADDVRWVRSGVIRNRGLVRPIPKLHLVDNFIYDAGETHLDYVNWKSFEFQGEGLSSSGVGLCYRG